MGVARNTALAYGALSVAIVWAWWGAVSGGPVFDDHFLVVRNACFRDAEAFRGTWTLTGYEACRYRPLRYVSYGIDYRVFGDTFRGYHVGNLLRHALAACALGWVTTQVFARLGAPSERASAARWAGFAAAALWAMHPVQTDSVSYVSGRRDVLLGLWGFVSTGAAWVALREGASRGARWIGGGVAFVALAASVLAKEAGVVFPVWVAGGLVLSADDPRAALGALWRRPALRWAMAVAGAVAVGMFVWRGVLDSHTQRHGLAWWGGDVVSHVWIVLSLQVRYVALVVGAAPLIGDYHAETLSLEGGAFVARAVGGAVIVAGLAAVVWVGMRRPKGPWRLLAWSALAWASALAPMSQIVPHHELFAEHYLYVPLVGAAVAAVVGVREALGRWVPESHRWRAGAVALVVALGVCAVGVGKRNVYWQDERVFYERVAELAPLNQRALGNLLFIYGEQRDWERLKLICFETVEMWEPGTATQRRALEVCLEGAARAGDVTVVLGITRHLVGAFEGHGLGWRRRAEALVAVGRADEAWEAGWRWLELTGSEQALRLLVRALAVGAAPEAEGERSLVALVERVEGHGVEVGEAARWALVQALDGRGQRARAEEVLRGLRAQEVSAGWVEAACGREDGSEALRERWGCAGGPDGPGR